MILINQYCKSSTIGIQVTFDIDHKSVSKVFLDSKGLFNIELDSNSQPRAKDFVNPDINSTVFKELTKDGVFDIEITALVNIGSVDFEKGSNILSKQGIYSLFLDTDFIFSDSLYEIDKTKSSEDFLWLKRPIQEACCSANFYKAYKQKSCFAFTCGTEKKVIDIILNKEICATCTHDNVCDIMQLLTALKIQNNCSSCDLKKAIFKKISNLLGEQC